MRRSDCSWSAGGLVMEHGSRPPLGVVQGTLLQARLPPPHPNLRGQERPQPESQEQVSVGTIGPLGITNGRNTCTVPADSDCAVPATRPAAHHSGAWGKLHSECFQIISLHCTTKNIYHLSNVCRVLGTMRGLRLIVSLHLNVFLTYRGEC